MGFIKDKKIAKEDMLLIDYLDPKDLRSPLPAHNTIKRINKLTPTQLCMAMHVFLYDTDQYYLDKDTSRIHNITDFLQGMKELPAQEDHFGILYLNHQILRILIGIWDNNDFFINVQSNLKEFALNDRDGIYPYDDLLIIFKKILEHVVNILNKYDEKLHLSIEKEIYEYCYGLAATQKYTIRNFNNKELINHPYFINRYFNIGDEVASHPNFHNDSFLINCCVIYQKYNILNVKEFLDYMYQNYINRDTDLFIFFNPYHLFDKFLEKILTKEFIDSLENSVFGNVRLKPISYHLLMRTYLFSLFGNYHEEEIITILNYVNDYFSELFFIEELVNGETRDKRKINKFNINEFMIAQRVWHFHEIMKYMLQNDDDTIPRSWKFEEYLSNNPLTYKTISQVTYKQFHELSLR